MWFIGIKKTAKLTFFLLNCHRKWYNLALTMLINWDLKMAEIEKTNEITATRIKSMRTALGLKLGEAAAQVGIGATRWQNWESGLRVPPLNMYHDIARVLGRSPAWLAGLVDHDGDTDNDNYFVPKLAKPVSSEAADILQLQKAALADLGYSDKQVTAWVIDDNEMSPELEKGDLVLFDSTVGSIDGSDIYALMDNTNTLWIRRVRPEMFGKFSVICNNPEISEQLLDNLDNLKILGRYIGRLNLKKNR